MKLTEQEKTTFNQLYQQFNSENDESVKQVIISELSEDDLQKFQFHLFNEAYKYSEDLKSGGHVPEGRLQITKDKLKEIAPYLVCAKVKKITQKLGENSSDADIKDAIKAGFNIQESEVEEEKLTELVGVIKQFKKAQADLGRLAKPEAPVLQLEKPGFWEKYFLWLIHLFVKKTAREISNENKLNAFNQAQAEHQKRLDAFNELSTQLNGDKKTKEALVDEKLRGLAKLHPVKEEAIEVQVLKSHLIKKAEDLSENTTCDLSQRSRPIHDVATVKKLSKDAEWIRKENNEIKDEFKTEILGAEFMRFFVPETPKYREVEIKNKESDVISKKVGFNIDDKAYMTLHKKGEGEQLEKNTDLAKQYYRIMIVNALMGNSDSHSDNIMLGKDKNGKETLYPIDFGFAFPSDYQGLPLGTATINNMFVAYCARNVKSGFDEARYEVSKIWHEKKQEIKEHLKNVSKALGVPDTEYTRLIDVIKKREVLMNVTITRNQYTLPPLIMGQHQIARYERENGIVQDPAPGMVIA